MCLKFCSTKLRDLDGKSAFTEPDASEDWGELAEEEGPGEETDVDVGLEEEAVVGLDLDFS